MTGKLHKDDPLFAGPTITLTAMIPFLFVCFVLLSDMNRAFMLVSLVNFFLFGRFSDESYIVLVTYVLLEILSVT